MIRIYDWGPDAAQPCPRDAWHIGMMNGDFWRLSETAPHLAARLHPETAPGAVEGWEAAGENCKIFMHLFIYLAHG